MNRITRNAVAGALAAAVALGAAAPAAVAAPKASHTHVGHRSAKAHTHAKAQKLTKAERRLAAQQRQLTVQARNKTRQLDRVQRWNRVGSLDDAVETAVRANVQGDIDQLGGMKDAFSTTDVNALRAQVRGIRPDVYNVIVSQLHRAESLKAALVAAGADPALVTTVDTVIETLSGYDSEVSREALRATQKQLSAVAEAVDADEQEAPETETPDTGSQTGAETGTVA